jgi:hypothetical protein
MGNGTQEDITQVGEVVGLIDDKEKKRVRIRDVTVLNNGCFNLFSIAQMLSKGWKLTGNNDAIVISNKDIEIKLDIQIPTKNGMLYGIRINRINRINNFCGGAHDDKSQTKEKMSFINVHCKLGHMSYSKTKQISKNLGWTLTNEESICKVCAEKSKACQKNINIKSTRKIESKPSGRIHIDITSLHNKEYEESTSKPYWIIIVDEFTQIKFSDFFISKNGMVEPTCQSIQKLQQSGKDI